MTQPHPTPAPESRDDAQALVASLDDLELAQAATRPDTPRRRDGDDGTTTLPPGEGGAGPKLGPFRVVRALGRGGMGAVYEAEDETSGARVALKVLLPHAVSDPVARERFLREARAASLVQSEYVVPILAAGEEGGRPYYAMPLLEGEPLSARLKAGPLSIDEAVEVARAMALGLAATHAAGVVHRDVKPGNVWLERGPAGRRVRLFDFGLARGDRAGVPITRPGAVVGTPAYMAPEQAAGGTVDARSDLFSLGAVFYEMLAGRRAFPQPDVMRVLRAVAQCRPTPVERFVPSLPPELAALVAKLLAKEPADRPTDAAAVAAALDAVPRGGRWRRWLGYATAGVFGAGSVLAAAVAS